MAERHRLIGRVLANRYAIEEHISEELLGDVFGARDVEQGRRVQVKVLHEHLSHDDVRFGRFLREVRATSMVRHVNTIELLDSGSEEGLHFVVMEYFSAHSLEEELQGGPLPPHRVAHIAAQIASAIGAAHQESVTHRALSPRNVLLLDQSRRGDFVKVRDFGLSKLEHFHDDDQASHLTEAGVHVGNTAYMSPEYIERDRFHPKGDLYALGCLMMVMLTGQPPFVGNGAQVLGDHVVSPPPRASERRPDVPEWLDDLIAELLAKRPEARPGAYQVVQRLEDGVGHKLEPPGLGAEHPPASVAPPERTPAGGGQDGQLPVMLIALVTMAMAGVAAVLGLLLVGMVAVLLIAGSGEAPPPPPTTTSPAPSQPAPSQPPPSPSPQQAPAPRPAPATAPVVQPADEVEPARRTALSVESNLRALVLVDGTPKGMTPIDMPVFPGVHRIEVMMPGKPETRQERKIQIGTGERARVVFTF